MVVDDAAHQVAGGWERVAPAQAWLLTGKKHAWLLSLYTDTMRDARAKLLQRSAGNGLLFLAELEGDAMIPKMDHLVCFMPGVWCASCLVCGVTTIGQR